jgi:hypothetical protein
MSRYILTIIVVFSSILFMRSEANACVNELPVPGISDPSIRYVPVGSTVSFHGYDYSYDPDNGEPYGEGNGITEWWWDVCDEYWNGIEIGLSGSTTSYPFTEPGHYYVELWVKGDDGEDDWTPDESGVWVEIYVVEVDHIEYNDPDNGYVTCPNPLYIHKGTTVTFKALPNPSGASWPSGKPQWKLNGSPIGDPGDTEIPITFNTVSSSTSDYKTVKAECGNTITVDVIVYDLDGCLLAEDDFDNRSYSHFGVRELIDLSYEITPSGPTASTIGGLKWVIYSGVGNIEYNQNPEDGTALYSARPFEGTDILRLVVQSGPSKGRYFQGGIPVIEPEGGYCIQQSGSNVWHREQYSYSIGILTDMYLLPTDVSFAWIQFYEGSCDPSECTGWFASHGFSDLSHESWCPAYAYIDWGDETLGCKILIQNGDYAEFEYYGTCTPYSSSTFEWEIPWRYRSPYPQDSVDKLICYMLQGSKVYEDGKAEVYKDDAGYFYNYHWYEHQSYW